MTAYEMPRDWSFFEPPLGAEPGDLLGPHARQHAARSDLALVARSVKRQRRMVRLCGAEALEHTLARLHAAIELYETAVHVRTTWPSAAADTWCRLIVEGLNPADAVLVAEGIHQMV